MTDAKNRSPRKIEKRIEINAPPEAVWKALTDAQELMRWFPLNAKVTPGKGGSIFFSWGPPYEGENLIDVWDPPRRLKLIDNSIVNAYGQEAWQKITGEVSQVAMDFILEGAGGRTVLRLVHSGFGQNANWEDEYDATNRGWDFELGGLKHYLERHAGLDRRCIWERFRIESTREEVWKKMSGTSGLFQTGNFDKFHNGDRFEAVLNGGQEFRGRVIDIDSPFHWSAVIQNLNDAYFQFRVDRGTACGLPPDTDPEKLRKTVQPSLWLSTYNLTDQQISELRGSWKRLLRELFR
jgi:uncharacterized protein YndB with AHSA1/START domain